MGQRTRATSIGRRAAQVVTSAVALFAVLLFLGVMTDWPAVMIGVAALVGAGLAAYVLQAFRIDFDLQQRWLQNGQAVVSVGLVVCSVILANTTSQHWISSTEQHQRDVEQVAAEASTVAGLLTTITNGDHDGYLKQLRSHVTDEVLQALQSNTVGMPSGTFTQTSIVTSVAVEIVNDGAATAISVVRPTPPPSPTGVDSDPNDIILLLVLAKYEDRWVVANLAPLGVRPGYAT